MIKKLIVPILLILFILVVGGYLVFKDLEMRGIIHFSTPNIYYNGESLGVNPNSNASSLDGYTSLSQVGYDTIEGISNQQMKSIAEQVYRNYAIAKAKDNYVVGWIYGVGTDVDYPVMGGITVNYWLSHNWLQQPDVDGSICRDDNLSTWGPINVIHGHNMASTIYGYINNSKNTMFASLTWFRMYESMFNNSNQHLIYLCTGDSVEVYQIFSLLIVNPDFQFNFSATSPSERLAYAQQLASESIYPAHSVNSNPLLLMNTCVVEGHHRHQITCAQQVAKYKV